MQIFEITQSVNEINYGSVLGGIAKYAGNQIGKSLGMQDRTQLSGPAAQAAAGAATAGVVKQQAAQQQQLWNNTLQFMKKSAARVGQSQIDPNSLATNFMKQLQGMLKPHGLSATMDQQNGIPVPQLNDFENKVDPQVLDQQTKNQIDQTIQQVDQAIYNILAGSNSAKPADLTPAWAALTQSIANAGSMLAFHGKSKSAEVLPIIATNARNHYQIGDIEIDPSTADGNNITYIINSESVNGNVPEITSPIRGQYQVGKYLLDPKDPLELKLINIIRKAAASNTP
jgi:hypothetical protein